jgi:hypothetical protein
MNAEATKEMWRQLRNLQPSSDPGITIIEVPFNGDLSTSHCKNCQLQQFGSCCFISKLRDKLPILLGGTDDDDDNDVNNDNNDHGDTSHQVQASVVLGAVLFLHLMQHYQKLQDRSITPLPKMERNHPWIDYLCGSSADLQLLGLGKPTRSPGTPFRYTLHPVYEYIMVDLLKLVDTKEGITATPVVGCFREPCFQGS